jgi:hypothetical protein
MGGARNTVVLRPEVSDGGVKVGARAVFLKFADEFSVRVDAQPPGTSAARQRRQPSDQCSHSRSPSVTGGSDLHPEPSDT